MASDLQQQVEELRTDLAAVVADASTDDHQPDQTLDELADRAAELVSATDLSELLVASGIGDADDPPASLPAAVASGEPQDVARLRSLLTASKLSTGDDDGREERLDELNSLLETAGDLPVETEATTEATGDDAASPNDAESEESEPPKDEAEEDEASTSPIRELLESQLEETHGIFDEIPDIETLTGSLGGNGDDKDGDDKGDAETVDDDGSHEDQSTRKSEGTRWRPGGGRRTTHSTVPGAGRRDIGRRAGRFSSARGSTISKR